MSWREIQRLIDKVVAKSPELIEMFFNMSQRVRKELSIQGGWRL